MTTKETLARIRATRPLASLGKGWATGVSPSEAVSTPPPPGQAWGCLGPLRGDTRWVCTVTAPSWVEAKQRAAIELQCEPYEVVMEAVDR